MIDIANKITLLRKEKGWSQTELAKLIGSSREIISKYEKDSVMPSIEMAKKIADAFGVSLDFLVGEGQIKKRCNGCRRLRTWTPKLKSGCSRSLTR